MGPRNAQELPWWPSGRELGPQECPKRGLGSVLATNFAPKGVPIGAWGAFFKRQGGVLGLRNAQELLWWPSGRELAPKSLFQMAESSPIVVGMLEEASKTPQEALLVHWDLQTSKLVS